MDSTINTDDLFPSSVDFDFANGSDLGDSTFDIDAAFNITDSSAVNDANVIVRPPNPTPRLPSGGKGNLNVPKSPVAMGLMPNSHSNATFPHVSPENGLWFSRYSSLPTSPNVHGGAMDRTSSTCPSSPSSEYLQPSRLSSARKKLTFQEGELGSTIPPEYNYDFKDVDTQDETWKKLSEGIGTVTPGGFSLVDYRELRKLWEEIQRTKIQAERDIRRSLDNIWQRSVSERGSRNDSPKKPPEPVQEEPCVQKKVSLVGASAEQDEDDTLNNVESIKENLDLSQRLAAGSHPNDPFGLRSPADTEKIHSSGPMSASSGVSDDRQGKSGRGHAEGAVRKKVEFALGSNPNAEEPSASRGYEGHRHSELANPTIPQFLQPQTRHIKVDSVSWPLSRENHISLSDLWGERPAMSITPREDPRRVLKKLAEEQCRRQLCEKMIQQLQIHLLEEKEKVAVAMEVDKRKNSSLQQMEASRAQLLQQLKQKESEVQRLTGQREKEKEEGDLELVEQKKRILQYEQELSKALDLAEVFKTKLEGAEKERHNQVENHKCELSKFMGQLKKEEERMEKLLEENRQSEREVKEMDKALRSCKEELAKEKERRARSEAEVIEQKARLQQTEAQLASAKLEKDRVEEQLRGEVKRTEDLEVQVKRLRAELLESQGKEVQFQRGLQACEEKVERAREEIHKFYQQQVERIVSEKLRELDQERQRIEGQQKTVIERLQQKYEQNLKEFKSKSVTEYEFLEKQSKEEMVLHKQQKTVLLQNLNQIISWVQSFKSHHTCSSQQFQDAVLCQLNQTVHQFSSPSVSRQNGNGSSPQAGAKSGVSSSNESKATKAASPSLAAPTPPLDLSSKQTVPIAFFNAGAYAWAPLYNQKGMAPMNLPYGIPSFLNLNPPPTQLSPPTLLTASSSSHQQQQANFYSQTFLPKDPSGSCVFHSTPQLHSNWSTQPETVHGAGEPAIVRERVSKSTQHPSDSLLKEAAEKKHSLTFGIGRSSGGKKHLLTDESGLSSGEDSLLKNGHVAKGTEEELLRYIRQLLDRTPKDHGSFQNGEARTKKGKPPMQRTGGNKSSVVPKHRKEEGQQRRHTTSSSSESDCPNRPSREDIATGCGDKLQSSNVMGHKGKPPWK